MGEKKISSLLTKLAIPAVIANLVSALYNIVDQIFIGQGVGYLGNAATNIAFPVTTICMAISLLVGVGGSANFNIQLGQGNKERARQMVSTAFGTLILCGVAVAALIRMFLQPLMVAFGATDQLLEYAMTYVSITSLGIPFLLLSTGGNPMIRADGSATYSMMAMVSGAVLNTVLDPFFIFVCGFGIAGAAWATVISQILSGVMVLLYLPRFRSVKLRLRDFIPNGRILLAVVSLGLAPMFFQLSNTVVQIVTNNLLRIHGEASVYGSEIPIAVAGIISKINVIYTSVVLGVSQGAQPIFGFNYGARKYGRVRQTYRLVILVCTVVSVFAFLVFQLFPLQIVSLFGNGSEAYLRYAVKYLRVFLFFTFINGSQIASTNFFSAIGKGFKGAILSLTKQIFLLVPLLVLLSGLLGVDGIMFAGPLADFLAWCATMLLIRLEFKSMPRESAA